MPRIDYADDERLSGQGSNPSNIRRMLAVASEPVLQGAGALGQALMKSTVPPRLREVAILRAGHLCGCDYEVYQHEAFARLLGFSGAQIAAIAAGEVGPLDDAESAVSRFVDDIVRNVRAGDETLGAVRQHLDDTQVVDLILTVGFYSMIARLIETGGVEKEPTPVDWTAFLERA